MKFQLAVIPALMIAWLPGDALAQSPPWPDWSGVPGVQTHVEEEFEYTETYQYIDDPIYEVLFPVVEELYNDIIEDITDPSNPVLPAIEIAATIACVHLTHESWEFCSSVVDDIIEELHAHAGESELPLSEWLPHPASQVPGI